MSIIKGIKVGSTDVQSLYKALFDSENLSVLPASFYSIEVEEETIYTGYPQTPLPIVTAMVGNELVTLTKDVDYTLSYTDNTNAGYATVTATGINNYSGTISTSWEIVPAEISVRARDQVYTYDGTEKGSGITVSYVGDNGGNILIEYGIGEPIYTTTDLPKITNVEESTTIYYSVTIPNHFTYEGSYDITVHPKTVELLWGDTVWRYDGDPHSTTCEITNLVPGDVCDVVLTGNRVTYVGESSTVEAVDLTNPNYTLGTNLTTTISILGSMYIKLNDVWTPVKKVYRKIGDEWVKQGFADSFDTDYKYVNKD